MLNLISSKCFKILILIVHNLLVVGCLKVFYNLIRIYIDEIQNNESGITEAELDEKLEKHFSKWFKEYVSSEILFLLIPSSLLIFQKLTSCMFNRHAIISSTMSSSKILQKALYAQLNHIQCILLMVTNSILNHMDQYGQPQIVEFA